MALEEMMRLVMGLLLLHGVVVVVSACGGLGAFMSCHAGIYIQRSILASCSATSSCILFLHWKLSTATSMVLVITVLFVQKPSTDIILPALPLLSSR